jgi:hypothetical protein
LKEMPVQQYFLEFTHTALDVRSVSSRLNDAVKKPCARTLSRRIWQ